MNYFKKLTGTEWAILGLFLLSIILVIGIVEWTY